MKRHNEVIGELRNIFKDAPSDKKFEMLLAFLDTATIERMLDLVKSQEEKRVIK